MGLTNSSTGKKAIDTPFMTEKSADEKIIALAGNPNVGKSTLFNTLTGLKQHTGNWTGKTVANASGRCTKDGKNYMLVDIPGMYSLKSDSPEERIARDFICFGEYDSAVIVCDATCLERNLNLVLQMAQVRKNIVICVNLMDEAKRKGISVDLDVLSSLLSVKVIGTTATNKTDVFKIIDAVESKTQNDFLKIDYPEHVENALDMLTDEISVMVRPEINPRWIALCLLENDVGFLQKLCEHIGVDLLKDERFCKILQKAKESVGPDFKDEIAKAHIEKCEYTAQKAVRIAKDVYNGFDIKLDKILTSKKFGYPAMLLLVMFVFWLTIKGANYPSAFLSSVSDKVIVLVREFLVFLNAPCAVTDAITDGVLRVLFWVISVMLPPMAIFFPLFTLLEDLGYLPRIAYNLDRPFKKCNSCGKQALTMCMGFGCNAAGVTGARIINSERERLIAIITNSLVPCNGRFPMLITLITVFFVFGSGKHSGIICAILLTLIVLLCVFMTFVMSWILSNTLLKGEKSSFILELPPYRKPQIEKTLVRSIFDRTIFVVARAAAVAAPAGLLIWLLANVNVGSVSVLSHISYFIDPLGRFLGMDGVILTAFVLGFPANEIVLPIIIMMYLSNGSITETENVFAIKQILVQSGWTVTTAVCTMLFSLFHFPCSTTLLTIKKETGSLKWTAFSALLPTMLGIILCAFVNAVF